MKPLLVMRLIAVPVSFLCATWSTAEPCSSGVVRVGFIPKLDSDPYFKVAQDGAQQAAKELGGEVIQAHPAQPTGEAQIEAIDQLLAQKVDVIAIAASDAHATFLALKRAKSQRVRVIAYDSDVSRDGRTLFINQAREQSLADQQIESMGALINYVGEVAILSSTPTAANQNAWILQIKSRLATDPKYAKMTLVKILYGEEDKETNRKATLELLQSFPHLKGIIVPAGLGFPVAAETLLGAQRTDVKLTGLAPVSVMKPYLLRGFVNDIWWNVKDLGYLTYYAAQGLAQCKLTGKPGETFKAGRLGSFQVGENGEVVLGLAKIVTMQNMDSFDF